MTAPRLDWNGGSGGHYATGRRYHYWLYRTVKNGLTTWTANQARIGAVSPPLWIDLPGWTPPDTIARADDRQTLLEAKARVEAYDNAEP